MIEVACRRCSFIAVGDTHSEARTELTAHLRRHLKGQALLSEVPLTRWLRGS